MAAAIANSDHDQDDEALGVCASPVKKPIDEARIPLFGIGGIAVLFWAGFGQRPIEVSEAGITSCLEDSSGVVKKKGRRYA